MIDNDAILLLNACCVEKQISRLRSLNEIIQRPLPFPQSRSQRKSLQSLETIKTNISTLQSQLDLIGRKRNEFCSNLQPCSNSDVFWKRAKSFESKTNSTIERIGYSTCSNQ